jgi:predicted Zn finger-like uncharacterized protein
MKIECPGCKLSGNIDDANVPATGLAMTCPRCKHKFIVEKSVPQASEAVAMLDTCPKCQYSTFSEEKFSVCPKCGLVVADYQQQQLAARKAEAARHKQAQPQRKTQVQDELPVGSLSEEERRRDEEMRRKHGLDKIPGVVEVVEPDNSRPQVEAPLPVFIVGWGTVALAIAFAIYSGYGISEYLDKAKEAKAALEALENAQSPIALFFQFLFFPVLTMIYAPIMLFFAIQFMALKRNYTVLLKKGAWAGVVLFVLMKVNDLFFWFSRSSSDVSLSYSVAGLVGDIFMGAMLIAPLLALAEFFSSSIFEKIEDLFA